MQTLFLFLMLGLFVGISPTSVGSAGNLPYPVPDIVGPTQSLPDCPSSEEGRHYCATLKPQGAWNDGWTIEVFTGANYTAYAKEFATETQYLETFKALLKGTKKVSDIYDENGALRPQASSVFALWPMFMSVIAVKDVEPVVIDGATRGFAFTPLVGSGDFPPTYRGRTVYLYNETKDLMIVVENLPSREAELPNGALSMESFPWKKTAEGLIDTEFYGNHAEMTRFMDAQMPAPKLHDDAVRVAKEIYASSMK